MNPSNEKKKMKKETACPVQKPVIKKTICSSTVVNNGYKKIVLKK